MTNKISPPPNLVLFPSQPKKNAPTPLAISPASGSVHPSKTTSDQISLSDKGKHMAKSEANIAEQSVDKERVAKFKLAFQKGAIKINDGNIAERLLQIEKDLTHPPKKS